MSIQDDIVWFKDQFQSDILAAIDNTPFRLELLVSGDRLTRNWLSLA